MSNSSIKSKTALLRNGETQKGNGYPEANDYSARILETMQTGVVFFNTEQIISGINNWHARIYRSPGILPDIK